MGTLFRRGTIIDSDQEINLDPESEDVNEKCLTCFVVPVECLENDENKETSSKIIEYYSLLNDLGKHEAEKRVEELTYLPQYTLEVKAAHNDHLDEPGELERMKNDLSNLKRPDTNT